MQSMSSNTKRGWLTRLVRWGSVSALVLACTNATAHAQFFRESIDAQQSAPCYVNVLGQLMHVVTGSLESCGRTIQATRSGYGQMAQGMWGSYQVGVDQNSNVYLNGQLVGRARNLSGTYGSLSDRCMSGDTTACSQWQRQTENAIEQYMRMYSPGWNR